MQAMPWYGDYSLHMRHPNAARLVLFVCRSQCAIVSQLLQAVMELALAPLPRDTTRDPDFARNIALCLHLLMHEASAARIALLEAHCSLSWLATALTPGLAGTELIRQVGAAL